MGLDITAYKQLTKVAVAVDKDSEPLDGGEYFHAYANPDFPGREEGVEHHAYYSFVQDFAFRAGSYSGYGDWRRQLADLAGWPSYEAVQDATDGPFFELLWFADNEGTIGPVVSAKLAGDFAAYQSRADKHHDAWFREKYTKWRAAFEMARDNGAVSFH